VTPPADGTELIDVKVREVSLVDRPAIRRPFVTTKSEDGAVEKSVTAFQDFPLDMDSPWSFSAKDGDALLGDPPDWERFGSVFVWFDSSNTKEKAGYKFPIAKLVDGKITAFWSGIVAARARVKNADVPEEDKPKIVAHLQKYAKKAGKEIADWSTTKTDEGNPVNKKTAPAKKEETEVSKATGDLVTALATDYVDVAMEKLAAIKVAATAGTLKRADLWTAMDGVYSVLYKLSDQLCVVAKSMGDDVEKGLGSEVEKADKKMTARRLSELKSSIAALSKLCGELEATMEPDETDTTDTTDKKKNDATSAASAPDTGAIAKAVGAELAPVITTTVTKALEPVETRLKGLEDRVEKMEKAQAPAATTETTTAKADTKPADDLATTIEKAVGKAVEPLAKRVSAMEAVPATTPANKTEKAETEKADANFWSGVV
jgi:hypothetical protein